MRQVYTFTFAKRLGGVRYPIVISVALGGLLAWRQPPLESWKLWLLLAVIAFMLLRIAEFMLGGTRQLVVTDTALLRSGRAVQFDSAELELRTTLRRGELVVSEVVLWGPEGQGRRLGVGFDWSLNDFEQAVREVVGRVPEERIVVSAPAVKDVRDERREKVLSPLRGGTTPAQRAMAALGRPGGLAPPPKK
ncbi:MAG: hypothetical protein HYZ28_24485 [Myxococcales bacterium]|nr:hypothetical protein [Myxococcales bacterium]